MSVQVGDIRDKNKKFYSIKVHVTSKYDYKGTEVKIQFDDGSELKGSTIIMDIRRNYADDTYRHDGSITVSKAEFESIKAKRIVRISAHLHEQPVPAETAKVIQEYAKCLSVK